jgi:hypothetical protein
MLPGEDPIVFELFVEWLYDGVYTLECPLPATRTPGVNVDVQAWILGERLGSTNFKNYVMGRLHLQYDAESKPALIIPTDVHYAFTYSAPISRLRTFFVHLVVKWFQDPTRAKGTTTQWDEVLQKHDYLRIGLIHGLRSGAYRDKGLCSAKLFMEVENAAPTQKPHAMSSNMVTPAKRNAEGGQVKKEPTGA